MNHKSQVRGVETGTQLVFGIPSCHYSVRPRFDSLLLHLRLHKSQPRGKNIRNLFLPLVLFFQSRRGLDDLFHVEVFDQLR